MRELKFRAWNKKLKTFAPENCSIQIQGDDSHVSFDTFDGNFDTEVWGIEDCELMQYTGLKDKSGTEIYEGDIVSDHVGVGEVKYSENKAAYKVSYVDGVYSKWFIDYMNRLEFNSIEVIGNVYENPELLEVER